MRTRDISSGGGGGKAAGRGADNLTTFNPRRSKNSGNPKLLEPQGAVQACNGIALPFYFAG